MPERQEPQAQQDPQAMEELEAKESRQADRLLVQSLMRPSTHFEMLAIWCGKPTLATE